MPFHAEEHQKAEFYIVISIALSGLNPRTLCRKEATYPPQTPFFMRLYGAKRGCASRSVVSNYGFVSESHRGKGMYVTVNGRIKDFLAGIAHSLL
jgi:hypothetical protein